ncbi:hypothetical protein D918_05914 [Trichuris suis]|nr:hypothetical protein D918_05914 [Trichuris suis]
MKSISRQRVKSGFNSNWPIIIDKLVDQLTSNRFRTSSSSLKLSTYVRHDVDVVPDFIRLTEKAVEADTLLSSGLIDQTKLDA